MPIVKLSTLGNVNSSVYVKCDTLAELHEKAKEKLSFSVSRFVLKSDAGEINDEDVFSEIFKDHPKGLELVALQKDEHYKPGSTLMSNVLEDGYSKVSMPDHEPSKGDRSIQDALRNEWLSRKKKAEIEFSSMSTETVEHSSVSVRFRPTRESVTSNDTEVYSTDRDEIIKQKAEQELLAKKIEEKQNSSKLKAETEKTLALKKKLQELRRISIDSEFIDESKVSELELKVAKMELSQQRIANLYHELKKAEQVDICFLIDCTGSMGSYINEAKTVLHKVINKLSNRFQNFQLRFSFVGYRDHDDGADRICVCEFIQNVDQFKNFVNDVTAKGGADQCEDVFGGLEQVIKLDWKHMSRVLLHIGDAPCHGARFHVGANDSHPGGDPRGLKIENLLKSLVDLKVSYYFAQINDTTIKMIDEFNEEITNLGGSQIKSVNLKATEGLADTVIHSISTTIHESRSKSLNSAHGKALKARTTEKLDWDIDKFERHQVFHYKPEYDFSLKDLETIKIRYTCVNAEIHIAKRPFAYGALRFAYAGYIVDPDTKAKKKCVFKESRFSDVKFNTRKHMEESIECQVISVFLTKEFEKVSPSKKSLSFVDISYFKVEATGTFFSLEEYLGEDYFKMTGNAGYLNENFYSATLDTFMHWSYQFTNQYLVVSDIQGARISDGYMLTDPAIICPDDPDRFTGTNMGKKGLKAIFRSHKCNHMCQKMKLTRQAFQSKEIRTLTDDMTLMK